MENKEKSKFEQILDMTTPAERMQMQQIGLNAFLEEDIEKFKKIKEEGGKVSFFPRLKAAWKFLTKSEVTLDLEIFVLKQYNDSKEKKADYWQPITDKTPNGVFIDEKTGTLHYKVPVPAEVSSREEFVKKVVTAPVKKGPKNDIKYKEDILSVINERAKQEQERKHTSTDPFLPEFDQTAHLESGFISGPIPTIVEPPKEFDSPVAKKPATKRVRVQPAKGKVIPNVHGGSGVKVDEKGKPKAKSVTKKKKPR